MIGDLVGLLVRIAFLWELLKMADFCQLWYYSKLFRGFCL